MVPSPEGWLGNGADVGLDLLLQAAPCGDRRLCEAGKAREFLGMLFAWAVVTDSCDSKPGPDLLVLGSWLDCAGP